MWVEKRGMGESGCEEEERENEEWTPEETRLQTALPNRNLLCTLYL